METGAAGCRGPEAQLLQVHQQQRSGSELQAAARAEEGPHVQYPGKQSGRDHSGDRERGSPRGAGTLGRAGVCTELLAAVAAVFEATVATLEAGLGRQGRAPSQPWTFPLFTAGTGTGKKVTEPPGQSRENKMRAAPLP